MRRRGSWPACLAALVLVTGLSPVVAGRQLASRPTPEWIARLERPERIKELKIDEIIARLNLKPGNVVADLGAGPGVLSLPLAKAVSPGGKVYAVEIDQQFLDHIKGKTDAQNVKNIVPVLGKFTDPNLPAKDVDLAFFHDVLHHVEDRATYLKNLAPYIKPGGRIAVVELDPVKGSHRDDPKLRLTKEQVAAWMADAGFRPVQEINDLFDDKWFVIYSRGSRTDQPESAGTASRRSLMSAGTASRRSLMSAGTASRHSLEVEVFKSPTCGCCSKWIDQMRQHGFTVTSTDLPDVSIVKKQHKVPGTVSSCHTALVGGYVVEGHVPPKDVRRLLETRPKVAGIAVPGMPIGSPGMEVAGKPAAAYDVVSFNSDGKVGVFASYPQATGR